MKKNNILKKVANLFTSWKQASMYTKIFLIGLFLLFILEAIGIISREIILSGFLLFTVLLFITSLKKEKFFYLKHLWILLASFLFLLYLFIISLFSLNMQISFEYLIFFLSLFLLYITMLGIWSKIEKVFLWVMLSLGVVLSIYSFLLPFLLQDPTFFLHLYPKTGYQYVYALFGSNNHLGEFLVFPILISIYLYLENKNRVFLLFLSLYFPLFFLSYSRTGYIGLLAGVSLLTIHYWEGITQKQKYAFVIVIVTVSFFTFLLSSNILQQNKVPFLTRYMPIYGKSTIETREEYFLQSLKGFLQYRYYGAGIGNFEYISKMFVFKPGQWTASAHNIFLDVLVETGTIGFILFVFFVILLLRTIRRHHFSIYSVMLLSWFLMIQFSYLHRMYSYLFLFPIFLIGSLHSAKKIREKNIDLNIVGILLAVIIGLFVTLYILSSHYYNQGSYKSARMVYPLQLKAYRQEFYTHNMSSQEREKIIDTYINFSSGEYWGHFELGKIFEEKKNFRDAIMEYEIAFWSDPFRDLDSFEKIYKLKLQYEGKKSAKIFSDKLFTRLNNDSDSPVLSYEYWLFINTFCQKVYNFHCPYTLE